MEENVVAYLNRSVKVFYSGHLSKECPKFHLIAWASGCQYNQASRIGGWGYLPEKFEQKKQYIPSEL